MGIRLEKCKSNYKVNEYIIVHEKYRKTGREANYCGPGNLKISKMKSHQVKNNKWRMVSICEQS